MGLFDLIIKGGLITEKFSGTENFTAWLLAGALLVIVTSYLLGSINGAQIVSKNLMHDDVTKYGSKNAGMTNMTRVFGIKAGIVTAVIDILKTVIAVFIAYVLCPVLLPYLAGLFCLIGHAWPVFYGFKGGKGMIVSGTMILLTAWPVFVVLMTVWALVVVFTKYVSLGSIIAALMYPFVLERINNLLPPKQRQGFDVIIAFVMAAAVIFLHRSNIARLGKGTENKIGKKVKRSEEEDKNGN